MSNQVIGKANQLRAPMDVPFAAELLTNLRDMARSNGHDFLTYLISLAEEEARAVVQRARVRA
jgi:hypothetical protein